MRVVFFLIAALLLTGCSKDDDPGFTSMLGTWTYKTPDGKIEVIFDIVGGSTTLLDIQNQTILVDGVEGRAEIQIVNIQETTAERIRINANDAALTFPYNITFNDLSASEDFKVIDVADASYTWPWGSINTLAEIQIVRK